MPGKSTINRSFSIKHPARNSLTAVPPLGDLKKQILLTEKKASTESISTFSREMDGEYGRGGKEDVEKSMDALDLVEGSGGRKGGRGRGGKGERGGKGGDGEGNRDFVVSKALSWILRHGALKEGLEVDGEGFVRCDQLVSSDLFLLLVFLFFSRVFPSWLCGRVLF